MSRFRAGECALHRRGSARVRARQRRRTAAMWSARSAAKRSERTADAPTPPSSARCNARVWHRVLSSPARLVAAPPTDFGTSRNGGVLALVRQQRGALEKLEIVHTAARASTFPAAESPGVRASSVRLAATTRTRGETKPCTCARCAAMSSAGRHRAPNRARTELPTVPWLAETPIPSVEICFCE